MAQDALAPVRDAAPGDRPFLVLLLDDCLDLCFNLMYATLDYVRRAGAETVVFGPTADDFKLRLGCIQQRRSIYTALLNRVASVILSSLGKRLLPERPAPPTHHVIRDHDPCSPFYPVP